MNGNEKTPEENIFASTYFRFSSSNKDFLSFPQIIDQQIEREK